jgi:hypothetical protein
VDDLDDLLAGRHGLQDLIPQGFLLDPLEKAPSDLIIDVRFQEDPPDLSETFPHHGFRQEPTLPELAENGVQLPAQVVEHTARVTSSSRGRAAITPGDLQRKAHPTWMAELAKLDKLARTAALLKA